MSTAATSETNSSITPPQPTSITAFEDPVHFNVKHPLQNKWTLWFDNPGKKSTSNNWCANLKNVITIDTVEDFWGVYNNTRKSSDIAIGTNIHLFKEGIRPEWEDPLNQKGGKWVVLISKAKSEAFWLNIILSCIGENYEDGEDICGAVISSKKGEDRIAIWTKTTKKDCCMRIGQKMKEVCQIPNGQLLSFYSHDDSASKQSSRTKEMYSV